MKTLYVGQLIAGALLFISGATLWHHQIAGFLSFIDIALGMWMLWLSISRNDPPPPPTNGPGRFERHSSLHSGV